MNTLQLDGIAAELGGRRVLAEATLSIRAGELLGVIGPNGAGKSSLLRVMAGLLPPAAGAVRLDGRALAEWPGPSRGREIACVFQDPMSSLNPRHRVGTIIAEPLRLLDCCQETDGGVALVIVSAEVPRRPHTRLTGDHATSKRPAVRTVQNEPAEACHLRGSRNIT